MKIKHFAGYGSVNAKKILCNKEGLIVDVWGNHEQGLSLNYVEDVFNWLVKRFDKKYCKDYIDIKNFWINYNDDMIVDGVRMDYITYRIIYR